MRVLVAMDSYKESLSAVDCCAAVAEGLKKADPKTEVISIPLSDGGEGMLDCLMAAAGGTRVEAIAHGLMGEVGRYAYVACGERAVVETAIPCGIDAVPRGQRDPMTASSRGVGDLIREALDAGYREIVVALGGSGCSDGGMGALTALGVQFYDENGKELAGSGKNMACVDTVSLDGLHPALQSAHIRLAADVTNPYCGPRGAACVYGPQKGATPEMVKELDAGLANLALRLHEAGARDIAALPGAGAAGGLGGGLAAVCTYTMCSGFSVVAEATDFAKRLADVDLVITGEGKTDEQTAYGKLPVQVAKLAEPIGKPVLCLSGGLSTGAKALYACGITGVYSIADRPMTLAVAMERTAELLADSAEALLRTVLAFSPKRRGCKKK